MTELDDLIAVKDQLLDWVATHAPRIHAGEMHDGPFAECDDEPCASAHEAITEAYRVMEAT